jgi:hypothetical protein
VKQIAAKLEQSQQIVRKIANDLLREDMLVKGPDGNGRTKTYAAPPEELEPTTIDEGDEVVDSPGQPPDFGSLEDEKPPEAQEKGDPEKSEEELAAEVEVDDDDDYDPEPATDAEVAAVAEARAEEDASEPEPAPDEKPESKSKDEDEDKKELRGTPSHIAQARDKQVHNLLKTAGTAGMPTAEIADMLGVKPTLAYISICRLRGRGAAEKVSTGTRQPHWRVKE